MLLSMHNLTCRVSKEFQLFVGQLELCEGALYALLGANGAGKSTLLEIMALLRSPDRGEFHFLGTVSSGTRPCPDEWRQQVTLVHQSPYLMNGSVHNNVALGLTARGLSSTERETRVIQALAQVGLDGLADRHIRELSGGEGQRVALARALVIEPKLLLLDEPMANLDSAGAEVFREILETLPGSGTTVVFSTHDRALPVALKAEVISIHEGNVLSPVVSTAMNDC